MLTLTAGAQTLNVKTGQVTYRFAAADTGDMTYSDNVAQYVTPGVSKSVTTGGTAFWNGNGYSTFSGGSSVTLSNYNSGGGGGGGFPGGGGGRW